MGMMKRALDAMMGRHNARGEEVLDPTPVAVPVRMKRNVNSVGDVRALIREELSEAAERNGEETFEESLDFEVNEDDDVALSRYEFLDMQQEEFLATGRRLNLEAEFLSLKEVFGGKGKGSDGEVDGAGSAASSGSTGKSGEDVGAPAEPGEREDGGNRAVGRARRDREDRKEVQPARPRPVTQKGR